MRPTVPVEVEALFRPLPVDLRRSATELCRLLVEDLGATIYVKTIYVGAEVSGGMIAALYPMSDRLDVALALPEDHACQSLEDATHLTWRTMPLLLPVVDAESAELCRQLVLEARGRVVSGTHSVNRDPEFFMGRHRRLTAYPQANRK